MAASQKLGEKVYAQAQAAAAGAGPNAAAAAAAQDVPTGEATAEAKAADDNVVDAEFSPDGRTLAIVRPAGEARGREITLVLNGLSGLQTRR